MLFSLRRGARATVFLLVLAAPGASACSASSSDDTAGGGGGGPSGGEGGTSVSGSGGWATGGGGSGGTNLGGAAGSTGGTAACVPACSGKQCGPDGCGNSCGSCSTGASCSGAGQCVTSCPTTWKTPIAGATPSDLEYDGASVYSVGTQSGGAWVARFDGCDGSLQKEAAASVSGATKTSFARSVLSGGALFAVGSVATSADPGNGLFSRFDPSSVAQSFAVPLLGGAKSDEALDVAASGTGFWITGTTDTAGGGNAWAIKANASGGACGFGVGTGAGSARAVAVSGDTVVVARTSAGQLHVDLFSDSACPAAAPCNCAPASSVGPITVGSGATEPRAIVINGQELYVAGLGWDGVATDGFGFVVRLDATGNVVGKYTWNPTSKFDGFVALTASGTQLFVGGGQGWDSTQSNLDTATAVLHVLPMGFGMSPAPAWTRSFLDLNVVWGTALQPSPGDGLFVVGSSPSGGAVLRCRKDNTCPP